MPMSDKEQLQMVKAWWMEYGYYLLFSVVFVIAANFVWHHWQQYQNAHLEQSSMLYMHMLTLADQKKHEEVKLFGEKLLKDYPKSTYASLAALILAKDAVHINNLKLADERLQFVVKKSPSKKLRQIARVRDARVLIAMKKAPEAIKLLARADDDSYVSEVNEVLGDAFLACGKQEEAEKAYLKAHALDTKRNTHSPLLKIKMQQF